MLQFIMDRNLLLYVLAAACAIGVVSQMVLKQVYDRLIRDTGNTGEAEGRFVQQLRQRFLYCTHLNEKVGDVPSLIRKNMMEFRFWRMSLHQWKRIGAVCLVVSLLCSFAGSVFLLRDGGSLVKGNAYFWMGVLAAGLTAAAYGIADTGYRRQMLEVRLQDYLQNSGAIRDTGETSEKAEVSAPIIPVTNGRKAKHRARLENAPAETRAAREKRELKETLSQVRAGIQESAAEQEREKEPSPRAELLRQLDPKDQERILREVLKEFLS